VRGKSASSVDEKKVLFRADEKGSFLSSAAEKRETTHSQKKGKTAFLT